MNSPSALAWQTDAFGPLKYKRKQIAYVERLPPEILSLVFEAGCSLPDDTTDMSWFDGRSSSFSSAMDVANDEDEDITGQDDNNHPVQVVGQQNLGQVLMSSSVAALQGSGSALQISRSTRSKQTGSDDEWSEDSIELAMDYAKRTKQKILSRDFQTMITHVCRRWRDVAIANPVLWNRIAIRRPSRDYKWLENWMKKSRESKLDIYLDLRLKEIDLQGIASRNRRSANPPSHHANCHGFIMFQKEHVESILSILTPEIRRWRIFDIRTRTPRLMEIALRKIRYKGAPQLETLNLGILHLPHSPNGQYGIFRGGTPALRQVRLRSTFVSWVANPFMNLKDLSIMRVDDPAAKIISDDFLRLLRLNPTLVNLVLHASGPESMQQSEPDNDVIPLNQLKSLDILWEETTGQLSKLLRQIEATGLTSFALSMPNEITLSDWKASIGIIGSFSTIKQLDLHGHGSWDDEKLFDKLFVSLSSLEMLRVAPYGTSFDRVPSSLYHGSIYPRGLSALRSAHICPRLTVLVFYGRSISPRTGLTIAKGRME
ncbi:hypothetical protein FRC03_008442, partial [Tulasnella sp. 419]